MGRPTKSIGKKSVSTKWSAVTIEAIYFRYCLNQYEGIGLPKHLKDLLKCDGLVFFDTSIPKDIFDRDNYGFLRLLKEVALFLFSIPFDQNFI